MDSQVNKPLTFNAIDVETANADRASICQIGIAHVYNGEIQDQWETLINPEAWFDPWNIEIHGIDKNVVKASPILPQVRDELRRRLRGSVLVSHTNFDRVAFERAMNKYNLEHLQVTWLDSAKIARRAWPDKSGGWGLKNITRDLDIVFKQHDALEDAKAAAQVVLCACKSSGLSIEDWLERVKKPISSPKKKQKNSGDLETVNPAGHLCGETIAFTGALSVVRHQAETQARSAGGSVGSGVTQKTTILVVGTQDMSRLKGYGKSTKHRKAEELILEGQEMKIISETDFQEILRIGKKVAVGPLVREL